MPPPSHATADITLMLACMLAAYCRYVMVSRHAVAFLARCRYAAAPCRRAMFLRAALHMFFLRALCYAMFKRRAYVYWQTCMMLLYKPPSAATDDVVHYMSARYSAMLRCGGFSRAALAERARCIADMRVIERYEFVYTRDAHGA